jgi:hypothetical protein
MKTIRSYSVVVILLLTMFNALPLYGADPDISNEWQFRFMPYLYMLSIDADGTVGGSLGGTLSGNVDLNFGDIVDYLDFGAMGRFEIWKDDWGFTFDGLFMNLSADGSFQGRRGITNFALDADVRLGSADFGLTYRLLEQLIDLDYSRGSSADTLGIDMRAKGPVVGMTILF